MIQMQSRRMLLTANDPDAFPRLGQSNFQLGGGIHTHTIYLLFEHFNCAYFVFFS